MFGQVFWNRKKIIHLESLCELGFYISFRTQPQENEAKPDSEKN